MKETNKLLIDSDFILWKILPNKKQTPEEIEKYGDYSQRTFEDICNGLDWFINDKILVPTQATEYIGFLGGYGNFRKEIAPTTYKANRVDMEFPKWFSEAKQYLVDKWKFITVDGIEAEDAVGICLTKYPDAIIVRVDHDLDQLPGTHYNPIKEEFTEISKEQAEYNQWKQCLTGCVSDRVQGIPKIGEVKASKILADFGPYNYKYEVLEQYINYFGEYQGILEFSKNYQLLKILREKEGFEIPEFTKVNKEEEIKIDF